MRWVFAATAGVLLAAALVVAVDGASLSSTPNGLAPTLTATRTPTPINTKTPASTRTATATPAPADGVFLPGAPKGAGVSGTRIPTVTVTPTATPTVTVTPTRTPSPTPTEAVCTGPQQVLLNTGFETGGSWQIGGAGVTRSTFRPHTGAYSLQLGGTSTTAPGYADQGATEPAWARSAVIGAWIYVQSSAIIPEQNQTLNIRLYRGSSTVPISSPIVVDSMSPRDEWLYRQVVVRNLEPYRTTRPYVDIDWIGGGGSGLITVFWVDDVTLTYYCEAEPPA